MKILTVKQPWASLIIFAGKDIENRDWAAPRKLVGQRIGIHSSKKLDRIELEDGLHLAAENGIDEIAVARLVPWPCGSIIGTVQLVACVERHDSPWFFGDYGFVLTDPRPLTTPIPVRGQLGFWDYPMEVK